MSTLLAILCCAAGETLLVSPGDLVGSENVAVVDVRSEDAYAKGHVPGAVRVDVEAFSENRDGVNGLLRPIDQLKPLLEKSGLHPDKHIVIVASMEGVDTVRPATRLFWILEYLGFSRVSLLDSGIERWQAENRELQTESVVPEPVELPELKPREELRATTDEVALAAKEPLVEMVDLRSTEEYKGTKKSGAVRRPGHISGAENVPASSLLENGGFKSVNIIEEIMNRQGVRTDRPTITYCNTGRQASVGYFALRLTGKKDVSLYDGSMSAWTASPDRPVETGPEDDPWLLHDLSVQERQGDLQAEPTK